MENWARVFRPEWKEQSGNNKESCITVVGSMCSSQAEIFKDKQYTLNSFRMG